MSSSSSLSHPAVLLLLFLPTLSLSLFFWPMTFSPDLFMIFFSTFFTKALGRPGVKPLIWRACHSRPFLCQKQLNIYQSSSPDSLKWNCPWPLHVPAVDSPGRTTGKRHLPVVTVAPCQSSSSSPDWLLFLVTFLSRVFSSGFIGVKYDPREVIQRSTT